ncbi:hypothetical protein HDZ31DRAFT_40101, partial [Schizophyllum fasciatum]
QVLKNCSPMDLINLRQTCKLFSVFANSPRIRKAAFENLSNPPKPNFPSLKRIPTDFEWAMYVFTGPICKYDRFKRIAFRNQLEAWTMVYAELWKTVDSTNKERAVRFIKDQFREAGGGTVSNGDALSLFRLFMRTPTGGRLFDAFRRDLELIDNCSWKTASKFMLREAELIAEGDMSKFPEGFQICESDMVLCPVCMASKAGQFGRMFKRPLAQKTRQLDKIRSWRLDGTRLQVKGIKEHFAVKHPGVPPPPTPGLLVRCNLCPHKTQTYGRQGLISHKRHIHGIVNPSTWPASASETFPLDIIVFPRP